MKNVAGESTGYTWTYLPDDHPQIYRSKTYRAAVEYAKYLEGLGRGKNINIVQVLRKP
jgi:hypothetical protein